MARWAGWGLLLVLWAGSATARAEAPPGIAWEPWSEAAFDRARREDRFVLLDLGAVWCHWCHVMDRETYTDAAIVALLAERYVAVRVDQDARPDLSSRYEDWGWPATIIFAADGTELAKFRGFIPPRRMESLLRGVIDDPTPGPSVVPERGLVGMASPLLPDDLSRELLALHRTRYDTEHAGWGFVHKFLDWDSVEYSAPLGWRWPRKLPIT